MNRSLIGRVLLAAVALAAVVAGAGGGRAATRAVSRAVADTGGSVAAIHADAKLPPLPTALRDLPRK